MWCLAYELGEHLCTITLHYCTAVGLILNKILDAPPPSSQESNNNESPSKRAKVKREKKRSASSASPDEKESKKVAAPIDLTGDDGDGGDERWL